MKFFFFFFERDKFIDLGYEVLKTLKDDVEFRLIKKNIGLRPTHLIIIKYL